MFGFFVCKVQEISPAMRLAVVAQIKPDSNRNKNMKLSDLVGTNTPLFVNTSITDK